MRASVLLRETGLPRHEAERLIVVAAGLARSALVGDPEISGEAVDRYRELVERRRSGEPLQYIEGTVQFGAVELIVDPSVLIPRPETEELLELALDAIASMTAPVVVDLCTGSGNLALAIKHARQDATVYATDLSEAAIATASRNRCRLGLSVHFAQGDTYEPLPPEIAGSVSLIVANPPYLAESELETLPRDVREYEPRIALVAGPSGGEVLAAIAAGAAGWLRSGGVVICEISEYAARRAEELFEHLGAEIRLDLAGKERFVMGTARAG